MRKYKRWSAEDRRRSLKITQKAQRMGMIPYPKKCNRCGLEEGIMHSHNEDYDYTLNELPKYMMNPQLITPEVKVEIENCLEQICWTCHMVHHSVHRNKQAHDRYFEAVRGGWKPQPVYKHNFDKLKKYGF